MMPVVPVYCCFGRKNLGGAKLGYMIGKCKYNINILLLGPTNTRESNPSRGLPAYNIIFKK